MKYLLLLSLLICSPKSFAQLNLVPNPSFEDTVYCPFGTNQLDACANWLNFGNSPDYFNVCTPFGVPNSVFGFQFPHSGNAYAGLIAYLHPNAAPPPDYREFIGIALSTPLTIGQKYFLSFFVVNAGNENIAIASDKLGANFYTVSFDSCCLPSLGVNTVLYADSIIIDTTNWVKIQGSFIADSAYNYLSIGNFFTDVQTDTMNLAPYPYQAYYYIDDVCVTTDSLYNDTWTSINESIDNPEGVRVFPNPTFDILYIESKAKISSYRLFTLQGSLIAAGDHIFSNSLNINLSGFSIGAYIIQINTSIGSHNHKIILTY